MRCMYCTGDGASDFKGTGEPVCDSCGKLLANPATALRLMRGHLTLKLRGRMRKERLAEFVDDCMARIAAMRPGQ